MAPVQVRRQRLAPLQVRIARKYSELARSVVHVDAQYSKTACRHHAVAKSNANRPSLSPALKLKVAQPAPQLDLRFASAALPTQHRQGQPAVRRKPRYAPVFQLNLGAPVVPRRHPHSFKQRRIRHCLIGNQLTALQNRHLPVHAAQPRGARSRLRRVLGPGRGGQHPRAHAKRRQPKQPGAQPASDHPHAIPKSIHSVAPFHRLCHSK